MELEEFFKSLTKSEQIRLFRFFKEDFGNIPKPLLPLPQDLPKNKMARDRVVKQYEEALKVWREMVGGNDERRD